MSLKSRYNEPFLTLCHNLPSKPKVPLYFKQSDPPQPSRRLLSEEQQEVFLSRGLTAAMYSQLTELQERDIFRLVQEGKPLTTGEKMQASSGL